MKKPHNASRFSKIMGAMVLVVLICFTASLQVYANTKMASKQSLSTKAEAGQDTQSSSTQAPSTQVPDASTQAPDASTQAPDASTQAPDASTQAPSTEAPSTEPTKPQPTMHYDISDVVATNDLDNITGYIEAENFYDDKDLAIELSMGGKTYKGTIEDGYFYVKIPYTKANTSFTIKLTEVKTGYVFTKKGKIAKDKTLPSISSGNINYSSTSIKGTTDGGATVVLKIGSKSYKKKTGSSGSFSFTIKPHKIGTQYTLTATAKYTGNKRTVKKTVKSKSTGIAVTKYITISSKTITGKVTGASKGDYVKVAINGKTYKGKVNRSNNTFSITIPKQKVGKNFTVGLYNQFSQRLSYYKDKIYLSIYMKIGMTKNQAVQTAWGYPDEIDYIYGIETWTYKSSSDIFYVYFLNGKVFNTYRYYYY